MRGGTAAIALLLLIAMMTPLETNTFTNLGRKHTSAQYIEYDEIWIDSDSSFTDWPGNGSIEDPYIISGLLTQLIVVRDTRAHFIISDCIFRNGNGIALENVTNGIVLDNQFRLSGSGGISIIRSSRCQLIDNELRNTHGIDCFVSNNTLVENNTVIDSVIAISIYASSDSIVRNNTMYRSSYYGIRIQTDDSHFPLLPSRNNSIYYNQIGCSKYGIAIDNGEENIWDDNISRGNSWYGYNGSGTYQIEGSAGSIDRYPSTLMIDCEAPVMNYRFYNRTQADGTPPLSSFTYEVSVVDPSGVDTVLLYYTVYVGGGGSIAPMPETVYIEMEHSPTPEDPHRYTHTIIGPLYGESAGHKYWANDTLGNSVESEWDRIVFGPTKGYFDTMSYLQNITLLLIAVFSVLSLVYASYFRRSDNRNRHLQQYSVKLVIPIIMLIVPYFVSVELTPYRYYIFFVGAGWWSQIDTFYGQFASILGITTEGMLFSPIIFVLSIGVQLPFVFSLNRYYTMKSSKRRTQIWGLLVYIIIPMALTLFSLPYVSPTYFRFTVIFPIPIVYVIGLVLMKFFPRDEPVSIEIE